MYNGDVYDYLMYAKIALKSNGKYDEAIELLKCFIICFFSKLNENTKNSLYRRKPVQLSFVGAKSVAPTSNQGPFRLDMTKSQLISND